MADARGNAEQQSEICSMALQWFYSKSKVPICLAIPDISPLLRRLTEAKILTETEWLELLGDTRPVHRVLYECLCWIEEKNIPLKDFFNVLFCKPFLFKYPKLNSMFKEYRRGKFQNSIHASTDKDTREKDLIIFRQEKVKICLAVTDLFPFILGLQDLTVLSETETLKLLADGRPVSRVVYECLSLIEKKDLKLNIVFEYIFQECYQNLYPGLGVIMQESSMEQAEAFSWKQCLSLTNPDDLQEFYDQIKHDISAAITERFPFLHGLCDIGLLSSKQLLKLLADKRAHSDVLYTALSLIHHQNEMDALLSYMFKEPYLTCFRRLKVILKRLNEAQYDIRSSSSGLIKSRTVDGQSTSKDLKDVMMQQMRTCRLKPVCYAELSDRDWELDQGQKRHANLHPTSPEKEKWNHSHQQKLQRRWSKKMNVCKPKNGLRVSAMTRKRRDLTSSAALRGRWKTSLKQKFQKRRPKIMKRVSSTKNGLRVATMKRKMIRDLTPKLPFRGRWKLSIQQQFKKKKCKTMTVFDPENVLCITTLKQEIIRAASMLKVRLELPKQVFDDKFQVTCGGKTGIFMKTNWKGDPSFDRCIQCDNSMFTPIKFEKYGGRAAWKNWKRSIDCAGITMESLFQCFVLKAPYNVRGKL